MARKKKRSLVFADTHRRDVAWWMEERKTGSLTGNNIDVITIDERLWRQLKENDKQKAKTWIGRSLVAFSCFISSRLVKRSWLEKLSYRASFHQRSFVGRWNHNTSRVGLFFFLIGESENGSINITTEKRFLFTKETEYVQTSTGKNWSLCSWHGLIHQKIKYETTLINKCSKRNIRPDFH